MNDNYYHTEPIEPFVWCVLAEMHIPLKLCRQCKNNVGMDEQTINCKCGPTHE
jgi:hypothetical protein